MLLPIGLLLLAASQLHAQLLWKRDALFFERTTLDHKVTGSFEFQNAGKTPIKIRSVKTTCGCTSVKLAKKEYQPGETGKIDATLRFGDTKGRHRRFITVTTDGPDAAPKILSIGALVTAPLEIKPVFGYWKKGHDLTPKTISVKAAPGVPVKIRSIGCSNPVFQAALRPGKDEELCEIEVRALHNGEEAKGELTILTDYPPDQPQTYLVHLRIK